MSPEVAPPMQSIRVGDVVGNYRIEGVIADGGMGVVYRAGHTVLPRRAAIKVLHPDMIGKWSASERMLQEARVMEAIAAPEVVQIYDAGLLDDGRPWVAMELVDGETLSEYLGRRGTLDPDEVAELLAAVADALAPAHRRNVVHRDVKPDNIMLIRRDGARALKLIDWGIARVAANNNTRITQVDTTPGTPNYMAPEQIRGKAVDGKTDVYALGVVAFELLTGKPPFKGENSIEIVVKHLTAAPPALAERCPAVPAALDALIARMMAKAPAQRPTLDEVRATALALRATRDDREAPEIEIELEVDLEADDEPPAPPALPRARLRWTPPYGMARGEVRRGDVVVPTDGVGAAGEIDRRR